MKILVVEDERKIASFIKTGLLEQGYAVDVLHDGDKVIPQAQAIAYDAIILDIMLPGRDGLSILQQLRAEHSKVPVIILTARSELEDRLEGLNLGADDYLTKPFYMEELIARLAAITRRATDTPSSEMEYGNLRIDFISHEIHKNEELIELTSREFNLLTYLLRSPGRVYTRTQILEHVWGYNFDPNTNLIDVNIQRLRKKLGTSGKESFIETVRGVGYRVRKSEETAPAE